VEIMITVIIKNNNNNSNNNKVIETKGKGRAGENAK